VGAALFTRTRNDIQLTLAGQRLISHAESILTIWNQARQQIAIEDEDKIPFAIAGLPSLWDIALQRWLHKVYAEFPTLALTTETISNEAAIRRLMEGTLDIAFTFEPVQISGIKSIEIMSVPLVMVSDQPGLEAHSAVRQDYVLVDWGTTFAGSHARHFTEMSTPVLRTGLGRLALEFILACGGTAYLAEPMVHKHIQEGRLHPVPDAPVIERSAFACFPEEAEKQALVLKLLTEFTAIG
jgi:DNA-binding transcriptional LysR family regulator